jgi:hypothetical protein
VIRRRVVTMAVVTGLLLATVSVATTQATQPSRSTYAIFSTICDGSGFEVRESGPMYHTRDYWYTGNYFFLVGGQWVQSGTYRYDVEVSNWGPTSGTGSGTFAIYGSLVGDYEGSWAWNWAKGDDGHGVGQGVGTSHGKHLKIDFLANDPVGLPVPPADWCNGAPAWGYGYEVVSTY